MTKPDINKTPEVDAYMVKLQHPLKLEIQVVRELLKGVNRQITEQIKWNAPSFSYKGEYLVTFNLRETKRVHLVWHNPAIVKLKSGLLEGEYPDRRMSYLSDMADVKAKRQELTGIARELLSAIDDEL
jgi:transposase